MVGDVQQTGNMRSDEPPMVCKERITLYLHRVDPTKMLVETALVRKYAGWCGGTAAKAASYPISPSGAIIFVAPAGR